MTIHGKTLITRATPIALDDKLDAIAQTEKTKAGIAVILEANIYASTQLVHGVMTDIHNNKPEILELLFGKREPGTPQYAYLQKFWDANAFEFWCLLDDENQAQVLLRTTGRWIQKHINHLTDKGDPA